MGRRFGAPTSRKLKGPAKQVVASGEQRLQSKFFTRPQTCLEFLSSGRILMPVQESLGQDKRGLRGDMFQPHSIGFLNQGLQRSNRRLAALLSNNALRRVEFRQEDHILLYVARGCRKGLREQVCGGLDVSSIIESVSLKV